MGSPCRHACCTDAICESPGLMHEALATRIQGTCYASVQSYPQVSALQTHEPSTAFAARLQTASLFVTSLQSALRGCSWHVHVLSTSAQPFYPVT